MKKLLKKIITTALILSVGGCSGDKKSNESAFDTSTLNGTSITIWTSFSSEKAEALQTIIDKFNSTNEYGITVTHEQQIGSTTTFNNNLYDAVMEGNGPDLAMSYSSEVPRYLNDDKLVDLSSYVNDPVIGIPNYENEKEPDIREIESNFRKEGQYIIITQLTGLIQIYNKTMYDELNLTPAKTWEELKENAKTIHKKYGIVGFGFDSLTDCIQMYLKQHGSDIILTDSNIMEISDEELLNAFNFFKEGVDEGYFQITFESGYASNTFILGGLGGYIGSCAGFKNVEGQGIFGDLDRQELAYAELPLIKNKWNPAFDRGVFVFNNGDENKALAAYLFTKFFTSTENSNYWCQKFIAVSPYASVNELPEYQQFMRDNRALQAFMNQTVYSGELPNRIGTSTIRSALAKELRNYVSGEPDNDFDTIYIRLRDNIKEALLKD